MEPGRVRSTRVSCINAGMLAFPAGIFLAGRVEISMAFISAAVLFLPLFVFMPKLIQRGMEADTDAVIDAFGKNEQVKKVFGPFSSRWPDWCWPV